jgi:hypothetical protein
MAPKLVKMPWKDVSDAAGTCSFPPPVVMLMWLAALPFEPPAPPGLPHCDAQARQLRPAGASGRGVAARDAGFAPEKAGREP